jgi:nitroreductase
LGPEGFEPSTNWLRASALYQLLYHAELRALEVNLFLFTFYSLYMEFEEVLKRRKMIRKYKDKPVPDSLIMKILRNAQRAPSAGFTQVQEFVIVKSQRVKEKLFHAALEQEQVRDAPVVIVVCSNTARSTPRYGKRGYDFYAVTDGAFASMLILLSCVEYGLGACFVGAFNEEAVAEILKLPKYVRPIGIITIGYPAEKPAKLKRIPLENLIHREEWQIV